jgi:lipoate-protein ligase B
MMEDSIVCTLAKLGIYAYWLEGKTGVWVKDKAGAEKKIASLGIAVRKGVSYHGLALNVNNDLSPFRMISPCGFAPDVMTSVKEILGREVNFGEIQGELARELTVRFEDLKR